MPARCPRYTDSNRRRDGWGGRPLGSAALGAASGPRRRAERRGGAQRGGGGNPMSPGSRDSKFSCPFLHRPLAPPGGLNKKFQQSAGSRTGPFADSTDKFLPNTFNSIEKSKKR
ncbi:Hypothetical protein NTJ_03643 [Nesidiocoris tenuis]|uniref:Uncharacterized protein n=2 Tax=Nesidiocoris tenuis TaxID=355587 RepID=A0ABN7AEX7_9HEMI|nr:Hypothetical protein NTJ_03643 [Nesidiocoris tenuis]